MRIYLPSKNADINRAYSKLPHTVIREVLPRLEHIECKIFLIIWDYTLGTSNREWIAIGIDKLTKMVNRSESTVKRSIAALLQKDLIIVYKAKSRNNPYSYNCYKIKPGVLEIEE